MLAWKTFTLLLVAPTRQVIYFPNPSPKISRPATDWEQNISTTERLIVQWRIGVIGTGDEGSVLIGALNPKYAQVVAIADIRPYNVYRAFHGDKSSANARRVRPGLMNVYGWADEASARENVTVYEDGYEQLLEDPNVEAVIIALPLHLHAPASIKAMRKGKTCALRKTDGPQCPTSARKWVALQPKPINF